MVPGSDSQLGVPASPPSGVPGLPPSSPTTTGLSEPAAFTGGDVLFALLSSPEHAYSVAAAATVRVSAPNPAARFVHGDTFEVRPINLRVIIPPVSARRAARSVVRNRRAK